MAGPPPPSPEVVTSQTGKSRQHVRLPVGPWILEGTSVVHKYVCLLPVSEKFSNSGFCLTRGSSSGRRRLRPAGRGLENRDLVGLVPAGYRGTSGTCQTAVCQREPSTDWRRLCRAGWVSAPLVANRGPQRAQRVRLPRLHLRTLLAFILPDFPNSLHGGIMACEKITSERPADFCLHPQPRADKFQACFWDSEMAYRIKIPGIGSVEESVRRRHFSHVLFPIYLCPLSFPCVSTKRHPLPVYFRRLRLHSCSDSVHATPKISAG